MSAVGKQFSLEDRLRTLTVEPWRNGGGITRTLATGGGRFHSRRTTGTVRSDQERTLAGLDSADPLG